MFKASVRKALEIGFGQSLKILPNVKNIITDKLTIFVYHDITDTPSEFNQAWGLAVSNKIFRQQISWISNNFNIIRSNDLLDGAALPDRSAVITFDDGFAGAFENGITYLVENSISSTMYLNMRSVLEDRPLISAMIDYLGRYSSSFRLFAENQGLSRPYFLSITPALLQQYEDEHGPLDYSAIKKFQGPFVDISTVKKWCGEDLVDFGNHLFDHWNSAALNDAEFKEQYSKNEHALKELNVTNNLFAFTNGQPGTCFDQREIDLLKELGAEKVFYSSGNTNSESNPYLLDRIGLSGLDDSDNYLWFRMFRLFLNRYKQPAI
jgi:peptidoglycan/xylan/chitin deacetylase (PgdA/CDA1 family)